MQTHPVLSIPYILDFTNLYIDDTVSFCLAMLFAVTVNSVAQAFAAISLGDSHPNKEERLHFNPIFYIDLPGLVCFLLAGFGWSKIVPINSARFSNPRLFTALCHLAGPLANFLLANIAASIIWLGIKLGSEDRVFPILVIVNVAVAVYNIIPIPPFAGGSIVSSLVFSNEKHPLNKLYWQSGPFILLAIFAFEYFSGQKIISALINPMVQATYGFIIKM